MGSITVQDDFPPRPPTDTILQVRTGKIRALGGVSLRSAIAKVPRSGKVHCTAVGLVGDEQQYALHGGEDKALHQYSTSHYPLWQREVPDKAHLFQSGGFGENLVTTCLNEGNVCIGDIFSIGPEVVVQVSEPRQPCYKLNHRFEWKRTAMRTQESGRTGWYLRVLKTGHIAEGDTMKLMERPNPRWSITKVQRFMYKEVDNVDVLSELAVLPGLGKEIKNLFQNRLEKGTEDMSNRLEGMPGRRIAVVWRPYRIMEKTSLTTRVRKFVFKATDTDATMPKMKDFAHVRLKFGANKPYTRAYSVVSGDFGTFELGVARDDNSRGGSAFLHDHINVGDIIDVAPGHDDPAHAGRDDLKINRHIFIIGGIGITAFLQHFKHLDNAGIKYEVHYAVRSMAEAAYADSLNCDITKFYAKDQGQRLDVRKIVPELEDKSNIHTMIYACGPSSMMQACLKQTNDLGYPPTHTHYEDFGGSVQVAGKPFEAKIKSSGAVLQVPGNKSLLEIMNEAGLEIPSSCLIGNCGVCIVDYCSGKVDHKGVALMEEEKAGSMLSCVSRGEGQIVIDS